MKEYFYFDYLLQKVKYANLLEYELNRRIYYYGQHFKNSFETTTNKKTFKRNALLQSGYFLYKKLLKGSNKQKPAIISSVYFNFGNDLKESGYQVYGIPWTLTREVSLIKLTEFIKINFFYKKLTSCNFNTLISEKFQKEIYDISILIDSVLVREKVKAVFIPQDVGFFERLLIQLCQKNNIPTFLVLHGSALRYGNTINDNKTDYLCVFGEILKNKLVESGFNPEKILITGHPVYSNYTIPNDLKFDFSNILVISKAMPGQPVEQVDKLKGRARDTNRLKDRGNSLLYLLFIKNALLSVGIKGATLRVHPSENSEWYLNFLGSDFFEIDKLSFTETLKKASLVIGPSSSFFLDALYAGVNYTIFEPLYDDGLDILNDPVGHPFDGSDKKIPVAQNENKLSEILKNKDKVDLSVLKDFVKPQLNLNIIKTIIQNHEKH
ncbi:hypothetical protein [Flavobacterium sp. N1736]|uniref:hypothetical protein n=1 Tax=Flavobacterium sp. N1736 TaxID=2986823 RepID=UPI002224FFBD|nr:hypothetical protein [Flavobacterium sp. N1736]